jgi:glutamate 5-kinase
LCSFMRNFTETKRIVVKVGTNVLSKDGGVDTDFLQVIAQQISELLRQDRQVILVTSGAIGMGRGALGIHRPIKEVKKRQACAAVGQGILMHHYQQAFGGYGQKVAQVLLTYANFNNRKYYVNLKNTVETLLAMEIVPIINENDCVSIDEIGLAFGDNDKLSALVASKIDAQLLIMLTDVAGLYDKNPRTSKAAQLIPVVYEITEEIVAIAGKAGTALGTGGMASKIEAIRIAAHGGCKVVLAAGREKDVILRIMAGQEMGTLFLPQRRLSNRKRWILNCPATGRLEIDAGAAQALGQRKSLLLVGVTETTGKFRAGDVVEIGATAKGIVDFSSNELNAFLKQKEKKQPQQRQVIVHANNLVLLD